MNVEQFEAKIKKAVAKVEKTRLAANKETIKYHADGCLDDSRFLDALERYDQAVEELHKLKIERWDRLDDATRLLHHYRVELDKARCQVATCEESLERKQAEYHRLLLMRYVD
jgi:hypothetical protein